MMSLDFRGAYGCAGTGRPVPKGLQDDPYAAEKYWQDWESGLNGKTPGDRPPSDWDGWDAPGSGEGAPPTDYIRSRCDSCPADLDAACAEAAMCLFSLQWIMTLFMETDLP